MPTQIDTPRRTELQDLSSLLVQIMGAKYLCDMPDEAMNHLRDAGLAVIDALVELQSRTEEDRQAKLDAIACLEGYNQHQCYTRQIARLITSLPPAFMMAAE